MEIFTHVLLFFFGAALAALVRHGLARSPDSTKNQYFVSATLAFKNHRGGQTERHYAGSFRTKSRDPDAMVKEFKKALIKLVTEEMPEEIFQLSDKSNYHIQIYSMNRI